MMNQLSQNRMDMWLKAKEKALEGSQKRKQIKRINRAGLAAMAFSVGATIMLFSGAIVVAKLGRLTPDAVEIAAYVAYFFIGMMIFVGMAKLYPLFANPMTVVTENRLTSTFFLVIGGMSLLITVYILRRLLLA
jgi:hypothetical protein